MLPAARCWRPNDLEYPRKSEGLAVSEPNVIKPSCLHAQSASCPAMTLTALTAFLESLK